MNSQAQSDFDPDSSSGSTSAVSGPPVLGGPFQPGSRTGWPPGGDFDPGFIHPPGPGRDIDPGIATPPRGDIDPGFSPRKFPGAPGNGDPFFPGYLIGHGRDGNGTSGQGGGLDVEDILPLQPKGRAPADAGGNPTLVTAPTAPAAPFFPGNQGTPGTGRMPAWLDWTKPQPALYTDAQGAPGAGGGGNLPPASDSNQPTAALRWRGPLLSGGQTTATVDMGGNAAAPVNQFPAMPGASAAQNGYGAATPPQGQSATGNTGAGTNGRGYTDLLPPAPGQNSLPAASRRPGPLLPGGQTTATVADDASAGKAQSPDVFQPQGSLPIGWPAVSNSNYFVPITNDAWKRAVPSQEERNTQLDYAGLAAAVYEDDGGVSKGLIPVGWEAVTPEKLRGMGLDPNQFKDNKTGFFSALYLNKATGKYVLAFRGTDMGHGFVQGVHDTATDGAEELIGNTPQYQQAVNLAKGISDAVGIENLSYTGHSKGGGEAAAASLVTQRPAVTFNAAAVNDNTLAANHANAGNAEKLITSFYVHDEPVSRLQQLSSGGLGAKINRYSRGSLSPVDNAQGRRIELEQPDSFKDGPFYYHYMDQVLHSMKRTTQ